MIIRLNDPKDFLVKERVQAPGGGAEFGRINPLMFTSTELRERFGIRLSETDCTTAFEVVGGLSELQGKSSHAHIPKNRVARLVASRPWLLPCFVAHQESPDGTILPMMTDGHDSRWSLFFEEDGAMTLVEFDGGEWKITPDSELISDRGERSTPVTETKSFLLNRLRSARKMLARSDSKE